MMKINKYLFHKTEPNIVFMRFDFETDYFDISDLSYVFTVDDIIVTDPSLNENTLYIKVEDLSNATFDMDMFQQKCIANERELKLKLIRRIRDEKLKESDKYDLKDFKFKSQQHKKDCMLYRQSLRDIPVVIDIDNVKLEEGEIKTRDFLPKEPQAKDYKEEAIEPIENIDDVKAEFEKYKANVDDYIKQEIERQLRLVKWNL